MSSYTCLHQVCKELDLGVRWFESIRAHVQMRIDETIEVSQVLWQRCSETNPPSFSSLVQHCMSLPFPVTNPNLTIFWQDLQKYPALVELLPVIGEDVLRKVQDTNLPRIELWKEDNIEARRLREREIKRQGITGQTGWSFLTCRGGSYVISCYLIIMSGHLFFRGKENEKKMWCPEMGRHDHFFKFKIIH